jgi:hypothetical protein
MSMLWWAEMVVAFVRDFLLPAVLAMVTSAIAIATVWVSLRHSNNLQRTERVAGEKARLAEAYRGAAERVLESLSEFVSMDPSDEDMRGRMRELRARVIIFQTLTRGESQERLGAWLAIECQYGLKQFIRVWADTVHFTDMRKLTPEYLAAMAPAQSWAADTVQRFAKSLIPPVDDKWFAARLNKLMVELSLGGDEASAL